jgi:hypothetical protein
MKFNADTYYQQMLDKTGKGLPGGTALAYLATLLVMNKKD